MMNDIETILFDIGGTLRGSQVRNYAEKMIFLSQISTILEINMEPKELLILLSERAKAYGRWARNTLIELNEEGIWTKWMAPNSPEDLVVNNAIKLNQLWRDTVSSRTPFLETKETVLELFRRGYRIGIVSNTTSSVEVPALLEELNIAGSVEAVLLSSQFGKRKPDPAILLEAARRMKVDPKNCVYIGDRLDRDVVSSRAAGFSKVIIMKSPEVEPFETDDDGNLEPDLYITNLNELLKVFPQKLHRQNGKPVFDVTLSSMWAIKKFPLLSDFSLAAHNLGFNKIELNHQVDSKMFATIDLGEMNVSSVHEPCPADISAVALKEKDWLISSTNELFRQRGVHSIKRSIDLAAQLKAPLIVVHCGQVNMDTFFETRLRTIFNDGKSDSVEYRTLKQKYIDLRTSLIASHMIALKQSLIELLNYAAHFNIRLGLENRYHYFDIPTPDEMEELLALAGSSALGFVYDVGHAQTMDRLGFFSHEEWLKRFSSRMLETHIHDVKGVTDHLAPGLGEVDFDRIAPYLFPDVIRTLELHVVNTPEQVSMGLDYLFAKGCISKI
ncbi:MAG: HAD-IIIA family hydrolase [Anaerolineaceae bacterium]